MKHSPTLILTLALTATLGAAADSPYINKVYEYRPAPGQFVNTLPTAEAGDSEADVCARALESIGGTAGGTVTLGAFGGYITFGFDHTVQNAAGKADFKVLGNSFFSTKAEKPDGGSSEPGVIMVSRDENGNGLPDDTWYEIRGTAYSNSSANFSITYYKPAADHKPVVSDPRGAYSDDEYIRWSASDGTSGYMPKLIVHTQDYYPVWLGSDELTFTGTRLPGNAVEEGSRVKEWVLYPVGNGYADCYPNDDARAEIDIDMATDADGKPANLPGIDFVRVYTGQLQNVGALGETSTEVCGAVDLNSTQGIADATASDDIKIFFTGESLRVLGAAEGAAIRVCDLAGRTVLETAATSAAAAVNAPLPAGIYLVTVGHRTFKAVKN